LNPTRPLLSGGFRLAFHFPGIQLSRLFRHPRLKRPGVIGRNIIAALRCNKSNSWNLFARPCELCKMAPARRRAAAKPEPGADPDLTKQDESAAPSRIVLQGTRGRIHHA
ncbi:hypothetical protein, partial [Rhodopseudomonas palustris]|uniref:hypothetical protein n=1 Tax=Rhodopseudomonas palustris TaxID=1076 RepID=UPI001AEBBAC6